MSTHGERLKQFVDIAFTTRREFAEKIGMEENSLGKYLGSGDKSLFGKKYREKLSSFGLNIGWYVSGEGEMLLDNKENSAIYNSDSPVLSANEEEVPYSVQIHEPIKMITGNINQNDNYGKLPSPDTTIARMIKNAVKKYENDSELRKSFEKHI